MNRKRERQKERRKTQCQQKAFTELELYWKILGSYRLYIPSYVSSYRLDIMECFSAHRGK